MQSSLSILMCKKIALFEVSRTDPQMTQNPIFFLVLASNTLQSPRAVKRFQARDDIFVSLRLRKRGL